MTKVISLFFLGIGIFVLLQVILPLLSYKYWELTVYAQQTELVTPVSNSQVLGVTIQQNGDFPAFISTNKPTSPRPYNELKVTIPRLNLKGIKTLVDSNDIENNLAHLPGSALPGERGNVFISGHSGLPGPLNPSRKAFFKNLPEMKKGDQIFVEVEGQKFEYVVEKLIIVDPKETWVINPPDNTGRYLSLMTCVPPGTTLKRLVVLTRLK